MTQQRRSPKGEAKRTEILETALAFIAEHGYNAATIRELADAVGLSKTGLVHHFGTKEDLFTAVLRQRDALSEASLLERGAFSLEEASWIPMSVRDNAAVPGLIQLSTRLSAEATDPANPAHAFFRERYDKVRSLFTQVFEEMREAGTLTSPLDPASLATVVLAAMEGLQTQWLYDDQVDMAGALTNVLIALGIVAPEVRKTAAG